MQYSWRKGEMLGVSSSGWECKGMIMPEFTLYIRIGLRESPRALYRHRSCSVNCVRTTLGSWAARFRSTGWSVNVVWTHPTVCVSAACALSDSSHFISRCQEQCFEARAAHGACTPLSLDEDTQTGDSTCPCEIPGPRLPLCRSWQGTHLCYCKREALGSKLVVTALLPLMICMHELLYYRL